MPSVRIWPTWTGALFLSDNSLAFGFYPPHDIPDLQRALENGMPVQSAAGFSGNVYALEKIRRIWLQPNQSRIVVEYRDFFGKAQDDFNFPNRETYDDFVATAPRLLGPRWRQGTAGAGSFLGLLIPLLLAGFFTLFFAFGVIAAFGKPPEPKPGEIDKRNLPATLGIFGVAGLIAAACIYWAYRRITRPPQKACLLAD